MTARKQIKTWKAWGVFTSRGALCDLWVTPPVRDKDIPALNMIGGNKALPVTISLSKPKRQARKVK